MKELYKLFVGVANRIDELEDEKSDLQTRILELEEENSRLKDVINDMRDKE